jgi:EmrB/QacA subfamily drug resistance transporter
MAQQATDHTGRWVLLSTIMASSMGFISGSALNVALPALQNALEATAADLLWITNGYLLLLASLILVGGSLGDHYGRRRIFGYGIWLFMLGSVLSGLSNSVLLLIVFRVVQGLGGAMMIPGSLAIISAYFEDHERGGAIGLWSAFTSATTVGGPIIGGFLADQQLWQTVPFISPAVAAEMWRGVFFINVPLAAISLYALYTYVPESRDDESPPQMDYLGAVLATLGLAGITYGFIQAGERGFNTQNLSILAVSFVMMGLFIWREHTTDHPMMPLRLFRSPVFSGTNMLTLFLYAALQGSLFFFSLNLIQAQGYPERVAGFATLPFSIMMILFSRQSGKLADRIGPRIPLTVGPAITGIGFALLTIPTLTDPDLSYLTSYMRNYFPGILGIGIGMSIAVAPLSTAVMSSVPKHSSGTASGINNAASRTAGVLAIAIIGGIVLLEFQGTLDARISELDLPSQTYDAIMVQASELGNVQVPASVSADDAPAVQRAIRLAFVDVFRVAGWIGAGLAWVSAGFAFIMLRTTPQQARAYVETGTVSHD